MRIFQVVLGTVAGLILFLAVITDATAPLLVKVFFGCVLVPILWLLWRTEMED